MAELTPLDEKLGEEQVAQLADWAVGVQRKHVATVRDTCLALPVPEAKG